jgi:rhamnulokinase
MLKLLAFDYGASSGRAMLGCFDGQKLELNEIHRFSNDPVAISGSLHWDILRLFYEMKQGISKCIKTGNSDIAGIGVDTWGVDFGLLGGSGELLGNPYHYRDSRTEGMIESACRVVPKREIYEQTGIAFQKFNTLYQLYAMKLGNSPILEKAATMLFTPDLLNYFLSGVRAAEFTIASTSQMLDARTHDWAKPLLKNLGIPDRILPGIISPGIKLGSVTKSIQSETGIGGIPVIAVAGHDTGSAVVSVPATEGRYAYLSSGTWSLLGIESDVPVINDTTYSLNYTNEGGFNNTTRLLKNIMGLWIYQECKRSWDKQAEMLSFDQLEQMAERSEPFKSLIDSDDDSFYSPGNMPEKVREFCRRTGQVIPQDKAAIVRCVMESLALKYRAALEGLEKIAGYKLPVLHVVGGGSKNIMLCRFTANAIGRPVITGPVEATAVGNLVCQLIALGEVSGLKEARMVVRNSFPTSEYLPEDNSGWDATYERFINICKGE